MARTTQLAERDDQRVADFANDLLNLYEALAESAQSCRPEDLPPAQRFVFRGFDGNDPNQRTHIDHAQNAWAMWEFPRLKKNGSSIADNVGNDLRRYHAMIAAWTRLGKKTELNADEINAILSSKN